MVTYDAADGYVVLFGGYNSSTGTVLGDTWTFSSGVWTQIFPTTSPPARFDGEMAYDQALNEPFLFGGIPDSSCTSTLSDTWTFSAGQWTQLSPSTPPPGRFFPGLAWDGADNEMVLYGGTDCSGNYYGDTWTFSGGQWTQAFPATSPATRFAPGMTWDANDNQVLLFGGESSSFVEYGDTWSFVGGSWTQLAPAVSPSPRALQDHLMASDAGSPIIFGGYLFSTGTCDGDTWTWAAGTWTQQSPTLSPPARGWSTMVSTASGPLLYGGYSCATFLDTGDTWQYIGGFRVTASASPNPSDVGGPVVFTGTATGGTTPYTYAWALGDAGKSAYISPTHTYNTTGTFAVHFWANETTGLMRSREANLSVVVNSLPTVTPTATPSTVDAKVGITFASGVAGGAPPYTVTWRFGNGASAVGDPTAYAYPTQGTYTAWVWANDSSIGHASGSVSVTINPALVSTPNVHPLAIDLGQTVYVFSNTSGGTPPRTSTWTFGDGTTSGVGNTSHLYAAPGVYAVVLWTNDTGHGALSSWTNVTVNPTPTVAGSATYPNVDVAVLDTFTATTAGGTPAFAYAWRFGDGGTATGSTATHTYSTVGVYRVGLWSNDSVGVSAYSAISITVFPPLVTWANATKYAVDLGMSTGLTGAHRGGAPPVTVTWSLGDGTWAYGASVTHTYTATGTYLVAAWLNDSGGGHNIGGFTVTVNTDPTLNVTSSNSRVDVGNSVSFTAIPTGGSVPFGYVWNFGDGTSGTGGSTSHVFTSPGSYFVQVWANDSAGWSAFGAVPVIVYPALQATANPSSIWTDLGTSTGFAGSATGGIGPYTFTWVFGDGAVAHGRAASHIYPASGTYAAALFVNDSTGGSSMVPVTVTVNPPITAQLSAAPTSVDEGSSTTLTVVAGGGNGTASYAYTYLGLPGGCASSDTSTLTCTPTVTGLYGVSVQVSDGLSVVSSSVVQLQVSPPLLIGAVLFAPAEVTLGRSTAVSVALTGGSGSYSYVWSGLPAGCSGATTGSFACTPSASGSFAVQVSVTDGSGATASATATLLVNPAVQIGSFTATPSSLHVGDVTLLSVQASGGTGALSYAYSGLPTGCSSQDSAKLSCSPSVSGSYTVQVMVTDAQGVSANSTVSVSVGGQTSAVSSASLFGGDGMFFLLVAIALVAVFLILAYLRRRGGNGRSPPQASNPSSVQEPAPAAPLSPADSPSAAGFGVSSGPSSPMPDAAMSAPPDASPSPPSTASQDLHPPTPPSAGTEATCLICGRNLDATGTCTGCGWKIPQ